MSTDAVQAVDNYKDYARSLINNLSLQSGHVLYASSESLENICSHLRELQHAGFDLGKEVNTMTMIHGPTTELDKIPAYQQLRKELSKLKKHTLVPDPTQLGGGRPDLRLFYPVLRGVQRGGHLYDQESGRIYY